MTQSLNDDIVTRLRVETAQKIDVVSRLDMKCLCCPCCEEFCLYCETVGQLVEAADEIEHLRKDRDKWRDIATELAIQNAIEYFCTPKQILDETWDSIQCHGLTNFEKEISDD